MKDFSFDEMDVQAQSSSALLVGMHDHGDKHLIAVAILDDESHRWVMFLDDAAGTRQLIASLQEHLEILEGL